MTIVGDHTDYNGGLSLPMAIGLSTAVTFTPRPGSFLVGIDSDQFPDQPLEIALGDAAPAPPEAALAAGLLRLHPPPCGGRVRVTSTLPVGAGLSSSAAFSVALLLALGRDLDPLSLARDCQEAERGAGAHVGLLDPLTIAAATAGHALRIDFANLETRPVPVPDDAAFVIVHSEVPRLLSGTPYATRRAECERAAHLVGRPLGSCELGDLSEIVDPVLRRRARHVVTECARVREAERMLGRGDMDALGALMSEGHRSLAVDYRVSVPAGRRAGRPPSGAARGPRSTDERRRIRRVRHRIVPARLAGARPRGPCAAPRLAGQSRCRRSSCCDVATSASSTSAARPLSTDSSASPEPALDVVDPPGHHERGRGIEHPDVAPGAALTLEHRPDGGGVEGGVPATQVGHRRRRQPE